MTTRESTVKHIIDEWLGRSRNGVLLDANSTLQIRVNYESLEFKGGAVLLIPKTLLLMKALTLVWLLLTVGSIMAERINTFSISILMMLTNCII